MGLGPSLEPGAARVTLFAAAHSTQQSATGRVGCRGPRGGSRQGVSVCGEVLGLLCYRTAAQLDYKCEQSHAVHAQAGAGVAEAPSMVYRKRAAQQDRALVIAAICKYIDQLPTGTTRRPVAPAVRLRPSSHGTVNGQQAGENRPSDQPSRLDCRTSGRSL